MSLGRAILHLEVDSKLLEGGLDAAKKKTEGWSGAMGGIAKGAAVAFAAVAAAGVGAVGAVFEMGVKTAETADQVRKLARETGLTTEEASKLRFVAEKLNIDSDGLSKSFGIFSKGLENNSKAMQDNHVQIIKNASGHIDLEATLGKLADRFQSMPDGVEKTGMAMELFGRSGKDMIPLLNKGSEGLRDMGDEATKLGLVFSKEGVESARLFGLAQKDLEERFEGMKTKIGVAVLPILTKLFDFFTQIADKVLPPVTEMLGHFVEILGEVFGVITGQAPDAGAAMKAAIGEGPATIIMGALGGIRDTAKEVFEKVGVAIGFLKDHWDIAGPAIAAMALTVIVPAMVAWGVAAVTAAASTIIALAPVLLPIAAIGAAVALLAMAWNSDFGGIQEKTAAVVGAIQDFFDGLKLFVLNVWRGILVGISNAVNGIIGVINGFIDGYNSLAEKLGLPLIGKIDLVTPNLTDIDAAINQVARDRASRITVTTNYLTTGDLRGYPQAAGGDYMVGPSYGGPRLFLAGEAGDERATFIPMAKGTRDPGDGDSGQSGHGHDIYLDGRLVGKLLGRRTVRDTALAGKPIG